MCRLVFIISGNMKEEYCLFPLVCSVDMNWNTTTGAGCPCNSVLFYVPARSMTVPAVDLDQSVFWYDIDTVMWDAKLKSLSLYIITQLKVRAYVLIASCGCLAIVSEGMHSQLYLQIEAGYGSLVLTQTRCWKEAYLQPNCWSLIYCFLKAIAVAYGNEERLQNVNFSQAS